MDDVVSRYYGRQATAMAPLPAPAVACVTGQGRAHWPACLTWPATTGVTLAYAERGEGDPPLVFVHGVACHRCFWVVAGTRRGQVPAMPFDVWIEELADGIEVPAQRGRVPAASQLNVCIGHAASFAPGSGRDSWVAPCAGGW